MTLTVQKVRLAKIKVSDRAREDKGNIEELANNIKAVGLLQPITVDQNFKLIAGERRYLAHKHLGLDEIDCVVRTVDGKIDLYEVELFENTMRKQLLWHEQACLEKKIFDYKQSKDGSWSLRKQAEEVGTASKSEIGRRISLAEAIETIPELKEHTSADDAWKEYKRLEEEVAIKMLREKVEAPPVLKERITRAKTDYVVGDAFEGMAALDADTFNFAEVDPPYGVALDRRKARNKNERPMDEYHEWEDFSSLFMKTCEEVYRLLEDNSFAVFWYGMSWHHEVLDMIRAAGFSAPDIPAIWYKRGGGQTASPDTTLGSNYEPFFLARKGKPVLAKPGRANVFDYQPLAKKYHPTEKPLTLLVEILNTCCFPGSNILIPYLGSGVTLRACYELGHKGRGWDLSQAHKDGFLRRIEEDHAKKG